MVYCRMFPAVHGILKCDHGCGPKTIDMSKHLQYLACVGVGLWKNNVWFIFGEPHLWYIKVVSFSNSMLLCRGAAWHFNIAALKKSSCLLDDCRNIWDTFQFRWGFEKEHTNDMEKQVKSTTKCTRWEHFLFDVDEILNGFPFRLRKGLYGYSTPCCFMIGFLSWVDFFTVGGAPQTSAFE